MAHIINIEQDTDEWLEWRNKGIGSSDVAILMDSAPVFDRTIRTLWEQRLGYTRAVQLNNEHIQRGKRLEPLIRDKVNSILETDYTPLCMENEQCPYLRVSLDGYDAKSNSIIEIKSPSEKVFLGYLANKEVPNNYYLQIQYQLLVSGADYAYFVFYNEDIVDNDGNIAYPNPFITFVYPNIALQSKIKQRCELFWYSIKNRIPIGWVNNELSLFPDDLILFVRIGKKKFSSKLLDTFTDIKQYNDSCVVLLRDWKSVHKLQCINKDKKIVLINSDEDIIDFIQKKFYTEIGEKNYTKIGEKNYEIHTKN